MGAMRQTELALRLLYEWRNGWSMGCGAAHGYSGSSSYDVTCLHVCTVHIHNRSVRLHNTHDTTPFARNTRKYVVYYAAKPPGEGRAGHIMLVMLRCLSLLH